MSKAEQIINQITEQIELLNDQPLEDFSGDTLSRIAVRLASYKAGLGSYITEAKKDTRSAEQAFTLAKSRHYMQLRDEKRTGEDAKSMKYLGAEAEFEALNEAQEIEDGLTSLSFNVHDLIDSIKSRIINQQMEMRESNVH